eukprot:455448_1
MSTEIEPNIPDLNVWSFIKKTKATKSASLKVLQSFILSLNKYELRHLIECYLKSKISGKHCESTLKYSHQTLIKTSDNNNENINETDKQILCKMNKKYGKKYNKKIIKKIQQNNKNILSIPPQIL